MRSVNLNNIFKKYIKIDSLLVLTALITLHGLLHESILTMTIYKGRFYQFMILIIIAFFVGTFFQYSSYTNNIWYLLVPLVVGWHTTKLFYSYNFIFLFMLMFFCQEDTIEKIVNVIYVEVKIFFWFHFIFFFLVNYLPLGLSDYTVDTGTGIRYSFFTYHPNTIARIFVFYIALSCFVNNFEMHISKWIAVFIVTIILYYYTKSDVFYLVIGCFIFSRLKFYTLIDRFLTKIVKFGVPFFVLFSLSLFLTANIPFLYNKLLVLSELMSGRLGSNVNALTLYGPTMFGQESKFGAHFVFHGVSYDWVYADNMYVYMIVHWGIIYLVLMALLLFITADKLNYKAKVMVFVLLMYGIGENATTMLYVSFAMLVAYSAMNRKDNSVMKIYITERNL